MIELLIRLCEKAVELIQYRDKLKRSVFDSHVEPIYSSIKQIVADYRSVLDDTESMLQKDPETFSEITTVLSERRKVLLQAREELTAYAKALAGASSDAEGAKFALACSNLIDVVVDNPHIADRKLSILSSLHNALSILGNNPKSTDRLKYALIAVKRYRNKVDTAWGEVTKEYHEIRVKCFPVQ